MTLVMVYVLPMLLGRTYDMDKERVGVDIFPSSAIENAEVIQHYFTDSQYKLISDTKDARDFLDVSGQLALKVKTGQINIEGKGSYLKESTSRSNTVEILVKVHYETVTLTIPSSAKPVENWHELDQMNVGTHYARSIVYGGDLVASLRFTARNSADRELIKATVQGSLQAGSGSFGLELKGNFNQIQEKVKDSATLEIHYYATVPIKGVPNDITSLMELVDDFPKHTKEVNNGLGVPLKMELFPLSALNKSYSNYFQSSALEDQINLLEQQFEDVRAAKRALIEWMGITPPVLPENTLKKIGEFSTSLEAISSTFYNVISKLDLSDSKNVEQFSPAFAAYDGGTGMLPDKYTRKFQKLRLEIIGEVVELQTEGGGGTYTHWGKKSCQGVSTETVYSGWAAGPKEGTTEFLCYPDKPEYDTSQKIQKEHYHLKLQGVVYNGKQAEYDKVRDKGVPCAFCRITKNRSTTQLFSGTSSCKGGGQVEYTGYLMSTDIRTRKKQFVCMASVDPEELEPSADGIKLTEVTTQCGTLPCKKFPEGFSVPCVVCSY